MLIAMCVLESNDKLKSVKMGLRSVFTKRETKRKSASLYFAPAVNTAVYNLSSSAKVWLFYYKFSSTLLFALRLFKRTEQS